MRCRCGRLAATVVPEPLCRLCAPAFFGCVLDLAKTTALERPPEDYDVAIAQETVTRICTEWHATRRRHEFEIVRPFFTTTPTLADIREQIAHVNRLKARLRGRAAGRLRYRESA